MSYLSFFKESEINPYITPKNYVSPEEWLDNGLMKYVLAELSRKFPITNPLYKLFLIEKIGRINNKLNKHAIIHAYLKVINLESIKIIIDNYKVEGQIIKNNLDKRALKDKHLILYILNKYLSITTNKYVYNKLTTIIHYVNSMIYVNSYEIAQLVLTPLIISEHNLIALNIINYRKLDDYF